MEHCTDINFNKQLKNSDTKLESLFGIRRKYFISIVTEFWTVFCISEIEKIYYFEKTISFKDLFKSIM